MFEMLLIWLGTTVTSVGMSFIQTVGIIKVKRKEQIDSVSKVGRFINNLFLYQ